MKKLVLYCLGFIALSSFAWDQSTGFSDLIREKIFTYADKNWPEKVYIHTDKPYYVLGEDLWFSTYLLNGINHKKSTKSNVVYVELIDAEDRIVSSNRYHVEQLSTEGNLKINKNWVPGNYLLRAYTNYMRNEDPQVFFQKEIQIVSLETKQEDSTTNTSNYTRDSIPNLVKPDLKFFPEGGYLVENINSKVAIKIKDPQYHNYKIPIEIVDSKGLVLTRMSSAEFGLGFFFINPQPGLDYFANLSLNDQIYQYQLPKALAQGYGLNVNQRANELLIGLTSTKTTRLKGSYLLVHQRGKTLFDQVIFTNKRSDIISLYKGNLQDGVTHITLFNDKGQPVCERLVYLDNPKNDVSVLIKKNKEVLQTREQISLDLKLQNSLEEDIAGQLSMSVKDLDALPRNENSANIKTWLLLNSDIRGRIENPGYFFTEKEASKKKYLLDLIMMTNGWRRFTWQSILGDHETPHTFDIEKGISIFGTTRMLEPPNNKVSTINTISFLGKHTMKVHSVNSTKEGAFSFGPYIFYDSIKTLIQSRIVDQAVKTDENYRDVLISIDREQRSVPEIRRQSQQFNALNPMVLKEDFLETAKYIQDINLEYDEDRQLLDEIVLTGTKKTQEEERKSQMEDRAYYGSPTRRLDVASDDFLEKTPLQFLLLRFPGIRVGPTAVYYRGEVCKILYNNMAVDLDYILSLDPSSISFIDFYDPTNSIQPRATGGVFTIYGKIGVDENMKQVSRLPGIINFMSKGFDRAKEFYAPDYSKDLDQMTKTDVRSTLHWEPKIRLSTQEPLKQVSFFTCDMKGKYIIEIEGITDSGIPVHKISYFSVN